MRDGTSCLFDVCVSLVKCLVLALVRWWLFCPDWMDRPAKCKGISENFVTGMMNAIKIIYLPMNSSSRWV